VHHILDDFVKGVQLAPHLPESQQLCLQALHASLKHPKPSVQLNIARHMGPPSVKRKKGRACNAQARRASAPLREGA